MSISQQAAPLAGRRARCGGPAARARGPAGAGVRGQQADRRVRPRIVALIGAALGLPLGIFLALLVTQALSEYDLQFAIPTGALITFVFVSIVAGIIAAILPARRAARLRVLEALQYE